uniref:Hemerythrin-like domain-containing protein n=1 Tax=Oxyrrhis marina TaxID=2969 RepID=A0A7S4LNI5_OXYMA
MASPGSNPYAKANLDWALYGFMVPHCLIRLYTEKFIDAVEGVGKMQEQKGTVPVAAAEAFLEWYMEYYYDFVHHHHDIEELNFFPWINAALKEKGLSAIPQKVGVQHEGLMKSLNGFKERLGELVEASKAGASGRGKRSEILATLSREVREFSKEMIEHLDEEEANVAPLIRQGLTEGEMMKKEEEIVQALGLGGAKKALPWIMEGLTHFDPTPTKEYARKFYNNVPGPLRLAMWASWNSSHATQNKGVVEALGSSETPVKGGACC